VAGEGTMHMDGKGGARPLYGFVGWLRLPRGGEKMTAWFGRRTTNGGE
jgi:hypothetical protein